MTIIERDSLLQIELVSELNDVILANVWPLRLR